MSSIMNLIRPELCEIPAFESENWPYLTLCILRLATSNIDQLVPNLATIYMPIRSWISLIMGQIEPEHPELFALQLEKCLNLTVYTLASTNINQSAPNLVKMYVNIRCWMNSVMNLIGPELFE